MKKHRHCPHCGAVDPITDAVCEDCGRKGCYNCMLLYPQTRLFGREYMVRLCSDAIRLAVTLLLHRDKTAEKV